MALELTLPALIRVATGVLFGSLGILLLLRGGHSPRRRPLAWSMIPLGFGTALSNLDVNDAARGLASVDVWVAVVYTGAYLGAGLAARRLAIVEGGAGSAPRADAFALATASVNIVLGLIFIEFYLPPDFAPVAMMEAVGSATFVSYAIFQGYAGTFAWIAARRARATSDARERQALAALVVGVALQPLAVLVASGGHIAPLLGTLVGAIPILLAMIVLPSAGTPGRVAFAALTLAGALVPLLTQGPDLGVYGIVRLVAVAAIALAVFRYGALGAGAKPSDDRRAALTTAFLVVLLIVAQVAQNFLSAQYGLMVGGVVAGALLFVARPIERALERRREHSEATGEKLEVYRDAARRSLRDGILTREEELHLARLARHLAIPHERALQIRHEVEDERRGSG